MKGVLLSCSYAWEQEGKFDTKNMWRIIKGNIHTKA
jgi:hypothetical protein